MKFTKKLAIISASLALVCPLALGSINNVNANASRRPRTHRVYRHKARRTTKRNKKFRKHYEKRIRRNNYKKLTPKQQAKKARWYVKHHHEFTLNTYVSKGQYNQNLNNLKKHYQNTKLRAKLVNKGIVFNSKHPNLMKREVANHHLYGQAKKIMTNYQKMLKQNGYLNRQQDYLEAYDMYNPKRNRTFRYMSPFSADGEGNSKADKFVRKNSELNSFITINGRGHKARLQELTNLDYYNLELNY